MTTSLTEGERARVRAGVSAVMAVAEAIRSVGSIPSGHLYAQLVGTLDLEGYQKVIGILRGARLVEERNHVLTWVGPKLEGSAP